ncbi:hypothetical protein FOYG_15160 [Fusarium oxysporum NRRL 32931]|uniref:Heterokaryon incompatibility domain-containing protein n=1 Tax=Fusarium oxysporum NRRL 32931 TaxID=660029 RepID=W9HLC6_FUSOX|nr:hypothetical protein FOYG_15160 [Fusarium oxysporum NRRL 32931]
MRLLSAEDLQFEDFFGRKIQKYAILSHRWGEEEPSYADMKTTIVQRKAWGTGQESPWEGQIYQKIYQFSLMALQAGYKYIWVDTCCIDKSSSAELQESINSMYQWYMDSGVCYVYLSDVSISASPSSTRHRGPLSSRPWTESFQNSQWFTRGWTLQELLAPRDLVFFDKDWNRCGNRAELQDAIEAATGIDAASLTNASLKDGTYLRSIRLGRLFSWTAGRQTTRCEDRAYSLLGLFNVNMPLLYGEKDRAFYRLQEEIIKESEDASLLAWAYTEADDGFAPNGLAKSPSQFHKYQNLMTKDLSRIPYVAFSPRMIARGLQVALSIRMDPFEKRLGYAVLAHEMNRRSLVLPVLFCSLTFVRTLVQNECVRFSDPVWVPSRFVSKAKPRSICFIRHVEATHLFEPGHGLSLGSAVWKSYTTTFTYPIQTQAGRRHFPALLGRFTILPEQREKNFTFIVELTARTNAKRIYVVIINYRSCGTDLAANMTITVLRRKWHINLAYAMDLVQRRGNRKSCELPDEYGGAIPTADIVYISPVTSLWVAEAENGLEKASSHPRKDIEVKMIGCMKIGSFTRHT